MIYLLLVLSIIIYWVPGMGYTVYTQEMEIYKPFEDGLIPSHWSSCDPTPPSQTFRGIGNEGMEHVWHASWRFPASSCDTKDVEDFISPPIWIYKLPLRGGQRFSKGAMHVPCRIRVLDDVLQRMHNALRHECQMDRVAFGRSWMAVLLQWSLP